MTTLAEQNRGKFKEFLDSRDLDYQLIGLWEYAIYPNEYQRGGGVTHLLNGFEGSTTFIGTRAFNYDVWVVELPHIIIDC
jgi:hypothetical protein